jgi:hypothetical protein
VKPLSRRAALAGAASLALAACGSKGNAQSGGGLAGGNGVNGTKGLVAIRFFAADSVPAGQPARLPFGLGNDSGIVEAGGPAQIGYRILDAKGVVAQARATSTRHARDLTRPYWPAVVNLPAGSYQAVLTVDGKDLGPADITVVDPAALPVPGIGKPLPALDTPTTTDPRGVQPVCTRVPACPFHTMTLTDALKTGKPVALLVATPAHCKTAICGPVLDVLMKQPLDRFAVVHVEVYTDDSANTVAPSVDSLGLTFEPCLFLADASGVVRQRLDTIFDTDELSASLATLL